MRDLVLDIDVGTSTTKAVLADPCGPVFLQKSFSYEYSSPRPGYAEQDLADWWNAVCSLTQELFKEHPESFARGVFFGLSAEMGRPHLFRAVLEANAFAIEHNLSVARTVGAAPRTLIAVGGPTRNALLCQIIADVTGLHVQVMHEHGGAALGRAILAAHGVHIGTFESMQAAHAKPGDVYIPSAERHSLYQKIFTTYTALYPRIKDLYPRSGIGIATAGETIPHVHL